MSATDDKHALIERIRANVPEQLRELRVWLLWSGGPGKRRPIYASGVSRHGILDSAEDRAALVEFEAAGLALLKCRRAVGLGVALGKVPGTEIWLSGIDLDDCYVNGELTEPGASVLAATPSYAEKSPSAEGLHSVGFGGIGTDKIVINVNGHEQKLEIYSGGRFFTVTGDSLNGAALADITATAVFARQRYGAPSTNGAGTGKPHPEAPPATDDPILVALKTSGLYLRDGGSGRHLIRCPWEALHSPDEDGNRNTSSTEAAYFAPGAVIRDVQHDRGTFKCMHTHCGQRGLKDLRNYLGLEGATIEAIDHGAIGPDDPWPDPLSEPAYHGIFGEIARTIEPITESDAAAVLLQTICTFGALVGRGFHVRVEGDEHHANLYAVLVGDTSKARKGTSWGRVREIFSCIPGWPRVVDGLSSGEGLKWNVRDPRYETKYDKKTKQTKKVLVDAGVEDKRLLVLEREFASVLRQGARAGNTLSPTTRSFWDTGDAMTLTKNDPVIATGAHICIVGHITLAELQAELTATDQANGFANRFLFMCVKRAQLLPFGGGALPAETLRAFGSRLARAAERAKRHRAMGMTDAACAVWAAVYPKLSEGLPGLLGAVTARAEAQCIRLALAYALANEADQIDQDHMLAALALWERSEASARHIFGSALGDRVADELLGALRSAGNVGLTRTQIRDLFTRHETADRIGAALALLARRGLARPRQQGSNGGRPTEIWTVVVCDKSDRSDKRS
jgi:hypothetical protein